MYYLLGLLHLKSNQFWLFLIARIGYFYLATKTQKSQIFAQCGNIGLQRVLAFGKMVRGIGIDEL